MLYYISWNDHWFKEHSKSETRNRKFEADILRASWVAELFFEWKEEKPLEFPPSLLAALSQNLFQDPDQPQQNLHPFEQVLATFNNASKVKFGKDGLEMQKAKK